MPSKEEVGAIFKLISEGRSPEFFEYVDDNVVWTVKGKNIF